MRCGILVERLWGGGVENFVKVVRMIGRTIGDWGFCIFFFFKQKTAYEIGTGDWSSDVCSSDLPGTKLVVMDCKLRNIDSYLAVSRPSAKKINAEQ